MKTSKKYPIIVYDKIINSKQEAVDNAPRFKAKICNFELETKFYTLKYIKKLITTGHAINSGYIKSSSQLVFIDIDNNGPFKPDYNLIMKYLKDKLNIQPAMVLTSMSHTLEHPKYRLVFIVDKLITNYDVYKILARNIVDIINFRYQECADDKCCNAKTLFFPCLECIYYNEENTISYKDLDEYIYWDKDRPDLIQLDYRRFMIYHQYIVGRLTKKKFRSMLKSKFRHSLINVTGYTNIIYSNNTILADGRYISFLTSVNTDSYKLKDRANDSSYLRPLQDKATVLTYNCLNTVLKVPISILFNVEENTFFDDIFKRTDSKGRLLRAIITKSTLNEQYNYWVYESGNKEPIEHLNIIELTQKVFGLKNFKSSLEFLKTLCNITDNVTYTPAEYKHYVINVYRKALNTALKKDAFKKFFARSQNLTYHLLNYYLQYFESIADSTDNPLSLQARINYKNIHDYLAKINYDREVSDDVIYKAVIKLCEFGFLERLDPSYYNKRYQDLTRTMKDNKILINGNLVVVKIPYTNRHTIEVIEEKLSDKVIDKYLTDTSIERLNLNKFDAILKFVSETINSRPQKFILFKEIQNYMIKNHNYTRDGALTSLQRNIGPHLIKRLNLSIVDLTPEIIKDYKDLPAILKSARAKRDGKMFIKEVI